MIYDQHSTCCPLQHLLIVSENVGILLLYNCKKWVTTHGIIIRFIICFLRQDQLVWDIYNANICQPAHTFCIHILPTTMTNIFAITSRLIYSMLEIRSSSFTTYRLQLQWVIQYEMLDILTILVLGIILHMFGKVSITEQLIHRSLFF